MSEVLVTRTWAYAAARLSTRIAWALYFRARHEDLQHIPAEGPALLCCNHQSFLDIPLVSHLSRRHIAFVARASLADSKPLGWLMRRCGAVLIAPGKPDRAALREMLAHLEAGDLVAIFPEGTRTHDGSLGELRAGALLAARQARAPIVPVGIRGAFEAWPRQAALPRPRTIAARVGTPVDPLAEDALEQVRRQLQALIGDGRYSAPSC